jgi:hypothetical protein
VKNVFSNTCANRLRLSSGIRTGDLLIRHGIKLKDHKQESIMEAPIPRIALDSTTGENLRRNKGLLASRLSLSEGS